MVINFFVSRGLAWRRWTWLVVVERAWGGGGHTCDHWLHAHNALPLVKLQSMCFGTFTYWLYGMWTSSDFVCTPGSYFRLLCSLFTNHFQPWLCPLSFFHGRNTGHWFQLFAFFYQVPASDKNSIVLRVSRRGTKQECHFVNVSYKYFYEPYMSGFISHLMNLMHRCSGN